MAKNKITIMDVAKRLQLSKGSVSKALHDSSEISHATRKRVKALADKLGYKPSSVAQAIRFGRASSVGLVMRTDGEHSHKPFLSAFIDGIAQCLGQHAYTLTLATASNEEDMLNIHANLVATKSVDAFILPRTMYADSRARFLHEEGVPFVMYGRTQACDDYAWFDINQEGYFARLVSDLVLLGHRRFAYLGGDDTYYYAKLRSEGFLQGVRHNDISEYTCHNHVIDVADGKQAAQQILCSDNPPTAFVCALDRAAIGVIQAANELNITPGKDISVAGYDGLPEGEFCQPPLSTCQVDNFNSGFQIADLVMRQISGEKTANLQVLGEAKPLLRGSIGPVQISSAYRAV